MMPLNQTRNDKSKNHKFPVAYISNIFKFNDSLIHSQSGEFESTILSPNSKLNRVLRSHMVQKDRFASLMYLVKSARPKRIKKGGCKVDD